MPSRTIIAETTLVVVISAGNFIEGGMKIDINPNEVLVVIAMNEREYLEIKDVGGINIKVIEEDWISEYDFNDSQIIRLGEDEKVDLGYELTFMYVGRIGLDMLERGMQERVEKRLGETIESNAKVRALTRAIASGV